MAESYGQCDEAQAKKLSTVIEKAIAATSEIQDFKGGRPKEKGGWKYIVDPFTGKADLSSTAWQLMFLRSAKNAGFDVPKENIDQAMAFVKHCFNKDTGAFVYEPYYQITESRAMAGVGIVAMAHGGLHRSCLLYTSPSPRDRG